jgi:predicted O-methyltransferase YrrM
MPKNKLTELKELCIENSIPIIRDNTAKYIADLINDQQYKSLLEIGSAYGYSALYFYQFIKDITTIEKNIDNFKIVSKYLTGENIVFLCADAFEYVPNKKYDVIFIDACKSHQDILVTKYLEYLNFNGVMFIDNIYLKKFDKHDVLTKNQRNLMKKVVKFQE